MRLRNSFIYWSLFVGYFVFIASGFAQSNPKTPSVLLYEDARAAYNKLGARAEGVNTEVEKKKLTKKEVKEKVEALLKKPGVLDELETKDGDRTAEGLKKLHRVKKLVTGITWKSDEALRCAELTHVFVGERRWIDWMPICWRYRKYKGQDACEFVKGDPVYSPVWTVVKQAWNGPDEIVAIQATDYVCMANPAAKKR